MAAVESFLITTLGPSIAKAILKLWLKDHQVAQDVSSDLVDLLKKKTEDVLARNRGERVFKDIGERVALSLQPCFTEFSEDQAIIVGRVAADSLTRADITTDLLAERNLDPMRLAQHVTASIRPAIDFNESAQALYDRVMAEACQHIVDIASSLPGFTERTFGEVLKREDELKDVGKQVIDEVQQLRQRIERQSPQVQTARFEENYRRALARQLDFVEIFGVDLSRASKRQKLSVAYISLSVEQDIRVAQSDGMKPVSSVTQAVEEPASVTLSAESALAGSKRVLIRGEAGSGKTTLLKWIAVQSAQAKFYSELETWNNTIPFFIRLRQFAEANLPRPEDFPTHVTPSIAGEMPSGWVHEQLRSGRAVILVDGVDEVPEVRRALVRDWLRDLITAFPDVKYIVTSRPYAIEEGWIKEFSFEEAELQPMDVPEINNFIEHWHSAVRESLDDQDEILVLAKLEENLKGIIRDSSKPVRRLATSPLLCAMICAMHRDRKQQLPQDRIELYEAGCHMLLERRDIERGVILREYPPLKYRQKRLLLEDLAYWMIKNDVSEADIASVSERFDRKLPSMADVGSGVSGRDVTRFFSERSGIIREPVKGRLDFTHRTFQEFLAAQNALDEEDLGLLVRNAHNDQWREVIVLAVGLASPKRRERLIVELIARGDNDKVHRHQLYLLAVACLEVAVELGPGVKDQVTERMKQVVPPKTLTEAKQLASAGELAVSLLHYRGMAVRTAAACVRTLTLIGSDGAVEVLRPYAADPRALVREELLKAASTIDPSKNYIARVLCAWKSAAFRGLSTLEGVEAMTDVEALSITELPRSLSE